MEPLQLKSGSEDDESGGIDAEESAGEKGGAQERPPVADPSDTTSFYTWTAIKFLNAPAPWVFHWTVFTVVTVFLMAVAMSHSILIDVSIESQGEIASDLGVREAMTPTEGLVNSLLKTQGDNVQQGEIIATMFAEEDGSKDVNGLVVQVREMIALAESAKSSMALDFSRFRLKYSKNLKPSVFQSLATVEQALSNFDQQKQHMRTGLVLELGPLQRRADVLSAKLRNMRLYKKKALLGMYIESSEDERGKLEAQIAATQNQAQAKLDQDAVDLVKSMRICLSELEDFIESHEVKAPLSGKIAKIYIKPNTYVSANKSIATILPENAKIIAKIQVRSKDIAGVKVGQQVLFKIEAFPYQRFGLFTGKVLSFDQIASGGDSRDADDFTVEASVLPPAKLAPEFRAKIKFVVGMRFTANILTDRKPMSAVVYDRLFKHVSDAAGH